MLIWAPEIAADGGTLHEQVVHALRRDIGSGTLKAGSRMPTQRELARDLGIGVGTVTRAYSEAERLGLLSSRVGRGTFVATADNPSPADAMINLGMNLPILAAAGGRLGDALAQMRRRADLADHAAFAPHAGLDWHRQAAAAWLARAARFEGVDWRMLLICVGAQQAMTLALDELCRPGDRILTEAATFHGLRAIADYRGYTLTGLAMDQEGLRPDALDRAAAETGARVVYIQPTLQNPTARSMSRARRLDIVRIARARDLWILEGDVYAPLAGAPLAGAPLADMGASCMQALPPIAALAPERTFYASSVSKALAPGLRCGFLVAPDLPRFDRLIAAMRATCFSPCTLGAAVASQWITDGTAYTILDTVAREAASRVALAREILGPSMETPSFAASLHVWLPMTELEAERIAARALSRGVVVTPPATLIIDGTQIAGLRLCLNAEPDQARLAQGLRIVAAAMTQDQNAARHSVV